MNLVKERRRINPLSGKRVKVRVAHAGALGNLNHAHADSIEGGEYDGLFGGRWKAKRDAKAAQKVRKRAAPTRKELKASKVKSKNKLRASKGRAKETRADAKFNKTEKGGGKVGDTLNKALELGAGLLNKDKGGEESESESASRTSEQPEKTFMQKNGLFIGIGAVLLIAIIIYFVTKKK